MTIIIRYARRALFIVVGLGVCVLIAALLYLFIQANTDKNTFTLIAPQGKVIVKRDAYGIPHIHALAADNDAFYALGFLHAKDRFWQMEFQRRVASGTLSEIFGKVTIKQDEYLRTWGFYQAAAQSLTALNPKSRQIIHAYTQGVNAYLAKGKLPLQFYLLHYHPKPWTDIDTVSWQKMMAWDLDKTWQVKIKNYLLVKTHGIKIMQQFLPPYPLDAPTVLSDLDLQKMGVTKSTILPIPTAVANNQHHVAYLEEELAIDEQIRKELGLQNGPGKGSNSWVISGKLTKTGKPILADDPHLALSAPSLWYQAELSGPTLDVIGATIPGLPVIVLGHNQQIAWGVTSGYIDEQDLYVEEQTVPLTIRKEIINIKGAAPETFIIKTSVHGPIISPISDAKYLGPLVAIKWAALRPNDTTFDSFVGINYARNWQDFVNALRLFVTPSQNFLYADVNGNIGYYLPGKIPLRANFSGAFPIFPQQKFEWHGTIPFDQLPHVYNPPESFIASANNKIVSSAYPYLLNSRFNVPPFRVDRIIDLIHHNIPMDVKKTMMMQNDTQSNLWGALRVHLLQTTPLDAASNSALTLLKKWDGRMDMQSMGASIFSYWYQALIHAPFAIPGITLTGDPLFLIQELQNNQCYTNDTPINCATYLSNTLQQAITRLHTEHGQNPENWRWGDVHHVIFQELVIGKSKLIGWIWNRQASSPGGDYTVNVGTYDVDTFNQTNGPSYRQIIDLADFNHSYYVIPLGEKDNPFSIEYNNQLPLWLHGKYLPMTFATSKNE